MSLMNAACCCDCVETGAMCITFASQEYEPGCYENVTLQEAENESGLWLGAGTDCGNVSGSGCPDCNLGGDYLFQVPGTLEKCCYQERIKTGCNSYTVDDCAKYSSRMTTKCECEMIEGQWGNLGACPCVNQNTGCSGCCPTTTIPSGTTGTIYVIVGSLYRDSYKIDWGSISPGCGQYPGGENCSFIKYEENYFESIYAMDVTAFASFASNLTVNDYHITCSGIPNCDTVLGGALVYYNADLLKQTFVARIYTSACGCNSDGICPDGKCVLYSSFSDSESGTNCICEPVLFNSGGEGYECRLP